MQTILVKLFKILHVANLRMAVIFWTCYVKCKFYVCGISCKNIQALGNPRINLSWGGICTIEKDFHIRSYARYSETGDNRPSKILVGKKGVLRIGQNVGITSTTIICKEQIAIGNHVRIGGGTIIFDTNFHSTDPEFRSGSRDHDDVRTSPVSIGDYVFIGTSCIITKGVTIGEKSIVAAGSVVSKSIPANQIWGGNPAKFIKELN